MSECSDTDTTLLNLVSFKWLMAGRGWWIDLSRLRKDASYASECAQRGLDSGSELLRQRSVELLPLLSADHRREVSPRAASAQHAE